MSNSGLIDSTETTVIGAVEGLNIKDFNERIDSNEIIVLTTTETITAIEIIIVPTTMTTKSASFVRSRDINQYVIPYTSESRSRKAGVATYKKKAKARSKPTS